MLVVIMALTTFDLRMQLRNAALLSQALGYGVRMIILLMRQHMLLATLPASHFLSIAGLSELVVVIGCD